MNQIELKKHLAAMAASPERFRNALLIPAPGGPTPIGRIAANFQRRDFAAIDRAFMALAKGEKPNPGRLWIERTKGASKDTDLAAACLWLIAFAPRFFYGQVGAADREQASELHKAIASMLRLCPWIGECLDVELYASAIMNNKTESRIDIVPTDSAGGAHGARPDLLILNELTHVSSREFVETMLDNADKMAGRGVVVIVTNAGHVNTWQEQWRDNAINNPARWYFSAYSQPSPWLDPADIEDARRRNHPNRFARLWQGEWTSDTASAIAHDDIQRATSLPGPLDSAERGWLYTAGLDIGLSKNASALVIVGKHVGYTERMEKEPRPISQIQRALIDIGELEDLPVEFDEHTITGSGRIKVARIYLWRPGAGSRVSIEQIEKTIESVWSHFRLLSVGFDPWQAAYLAERLRGKGITADEVYFTGDALKSMCIATLEAFSERQIDLYPDETLLADLAALRVVEKSFGSRLESPQAKDGTHGDAATGLAIALHTMKKHSWQAAADAESGRPLVCWP